MLVRKKKDQVVILPPKLIKEKNKLTNKIKTNAKGSGQMQLDYGQLPYS
jgi:hypothetical protein